MSELYRKTAREAVELLRRREVTPGELLDCSMERIRETDNQINALPTRCFKRARGAIAQLKPDDGSPGWLGGLPVSIKDLNDVEGVRTTHGSKAFEHNVPVQSDLLVEQIESRGGLVVAKSNTPEFGAGGNTFNAVFGATKTPWDTSRTSGGSSGGAAAALASGQVWLAHGSDMGGSLRTPASFCGVVGLRPSLGRVARAPVADPFDTLSVNGPMARNVGDAALFLDAMVGEHPRDPVSLPRPALSFQSAAERPARPMRVAFSTNLGIGPVDREVAEACRRFADLLARDGVDVVEDCPDFSGAQQTFERLRGILFSTIYSPILKLHRDVMKPELVENIERGTKLGVEAISEAQRRRAALFQQTVQFFQCYDLLLCPAAVVLPFDADTRWPGEVAGVPTPNYLDWLSICCVITLTTAPSLSMPVQFSKSGLPIGMQLVASPRGEHALLSHASYIEKLLGLAERLPIDPRSAG